MTGDNCGHCGLGVGSLLRSDDNPSGLCGRCLSIPAYIPAKWHSRIRVVKDERGLHYLWTGWHNGEGHAKARVHGLAVYVYRYLYEQITGTVLTKRDIIDHTCERKPCLNFEHWERTTPRGNQHHRGKGARYLYKRKEEYANGPV